MLQALHSLPRPAGLGKPACCDGCRHFCRNVSFADLLGLQAAIRKEAGQLPRGASCAIVNSPGAGRGAEIDAADVVIRLGFDSGGVEADVGQRTTYRLVGVGRGETLPMPAPGERLIAICPQKAQLGKCWLRVPQRPVLRFTPPVAPFDPVVLAQRLAHKVCNTSKLFQDPCSPRSSLKLQRRCAEHPPELVWLSGALRSRFKAERPTRLIYVYDHGIAWRALGKAARSPYGSPLDDRGTTLDKWFDWMNAVLARAEFHRTSSPAEADLFYVPSPAKFHRAPFDSGSAAWCDRPTETLDAYWMNSSHNYFRRRGGRDHFTAFTWRESVVVQDGWSPGSHSPGCVSWSREPALANVTKLVGVMKSPWFAEPWASTSLRPWRRVEAPKTVEEDTATALRLVEAPYSPGGVHDLSAWNLDQRAPRDRWCLLASTRMATETGSIRWS